MKDFANYLSNVSYPREFSNTFYYKEGDYYSPSFNMIKDFGLYAQNLFNDLTTIKENYETIFNKETPFTIEQAFTMFNNYYDGFIKIATNYKQCYRKHKSEFNDNYNWQSNERFYLLSRKNYYKPDLLITLNEHTMQVNPNYYNQLNFFANALFALEQKCKQATQVIWNNYLKLSNDKVFALVVKQLTNWRTNIDTPEKVDYMNKRVATSASLITSQKSKFFKDPDKNKVCAGLVYTVTASDIICAYKDDAFMVEEIEGKNPILDGEHNFFSNVFRVYNQDGHAVYSKGTQITTPVGLFTRYCDNFNELILNNTTIKAHSIFYVNKHDRFYVNANESLKYAQALSKEYNLPIIELESKNDFWDNKELNILK